MYKWVLHTFFFLLSGTLNAQDQSTGLLRDLERHDRAVLVKDDIWIRDPYITLASDSNYYLTGTTRIVDNNWQGSGGAKKKNKAPVGSAVRVWKSPDLVHWQYIGEIFDMRQGYWGLGEKVPANPALANERHLWAPELHFINGRWLLVHTTPGPDLQKSNLAVSRGSSLEGPYDFPLGECAANLHDPSIFQDTDGRIYLLWANTQIAELRPDLGGFVGKPEEIYPANKRKMPNGSFKQGIGHEGCYMLKIGGKYVLVGTGWSTNRMRHGSYNLYYAVADNIRGPYGPRKFLGRFLGHGTPFKDRLGRWWCTAFYNANRPTLNKGGIRNRDLSDDAYTINPQGLTLVPLEITQLASGDIEISALDPDYAQPGPDEVQPF
ncbi:hypothetical protein GCM10027051_26680 [Niabella terrae]